MAGKESKRNRGKVPKKSSVKTISGCVRLTRYMSNLIPYLPVNAKLAQLVRGIRLRNVKVCVRIAGLAPMKKTTREKCYKELKKLDKKRDSLKEKMRTWNGSLPVKLVEQMDKNLNKAHELIATMAI